MYLGRLVLTLFCVIALMPQMISHAQQDRSLNVIRQTPNERRIALVIGNGAYAQGSLTNPVNDAHDIAATLRTAGFEVLHGADQNRKQMRELIRQFGEKIRNGGVGLFYFAGHGVQVNNTNFMIPVGAEITKDTEVEDESVSVNFVLAQMEDARNKLNIVILDACRNNPFARSFRTESRGLAITRGAPTGTLVAYATAENNVASDGAGRNGLFTQELLTNLKTPGLTLESVFRRTRTSVRSKSGGQQVPYEYTSVEGEDFYFLPPNSAMPPPPVIIPTPVTATAPPVTKPTVRMSVAGVPLAAMSFVTASVEVNGNVVNQRQDQGWGFVEDLGNGVKLPMVEIPGGTFQMGSTNSAAQKAFAEAKRYDKYAQLGWFTNNQPQHQVRVSGFAMGSYEVTQAQWQAIMGNNPAHFKGDMDLPVEQVSWEEAQEFCRKLSARTGHNYRLPTEAEWEYAARAGTTTAFAFGDTLSTQIENYNGIYLNQQAAKDSFRTKSVGSLGVANGFGLYDMHGNVAEWCEDMWHENYAGAPSDGSAWVTGDDNSKRVVRGGAWGRSAIYCHSASRSVIQPGVTSLNNIGLRVVLSARTP